MTLKLSLLSALLFSLAGHAAVSMNMKPGLWAMQVEIENDGKTVNVNQQIAQAMAKLTPEQRKQMQEMMGTVASPAGTQTCFTQDMLTPEKMLKQQSQEKCDVKITSSSPTALAGTYTCQDGTKGDMKWTSAPEKMTGIINMNSPKRGKGKITMNGTFVSSDCGKVKPAVN